MAHPVILHANHFQFAGGQEIENPCVGSRMLLWCRQGLGTVVVDGRAAPLTADRWLLLPWRHRVNYTADMRRPFLVGGIHICPDHDLGTTVELRVPHTAEDPLFASPSRRDHPWSGLTGIPGGGFADHPLLRDLGEWIVARWIIDRVDPDQARAMAVLLVDALQATVERPGATFLPSPLEAAIRRARADLARAQDLAGMAAAAGCSPATLVRLFRAHFRRSPMAWLRSERIEIARRLLATTSLSMGEIGARVGIADPRRFAKTFRASTGTSPRRWRQQRRL